MIKSGDLYKKGDFSTNKRYFLIKNDTLYYFNSIQESTGSAIKQFDLTKLKSVEKTGKTIVINQSFKYQFRLKLKGKSNDLVLYSNTPQDCEKWVQTLSNWIQKDQRESEKTEIPDKRFSTNKKKKKRFFESIDL